MSAPESSLRSPMLVDLARLSMIDMFFVSHPSEQAAKAKKGVKGGLVHESRKHLLADMYVLHRVESGILDPRLTTS